jgi:hypothetical protein
MCFTTSLSTRAVSRSLSFTDLESALAAARPVGNDNGRRVSRRKQKGVRFAEAESDVPRPELALALLRHLLCHPINRAILLRKNQEQLKELSDHILSQERLDHFARRLHDNVGTEEVAQMALLLR